MRKRKKFIVFNIFIILFIVLSISSINNKEKIVNKSFKYISSSNYKNIIRESTNEIIGEVNIPKINLTKNLYDLNSIYNNIDYNIEIHKKSDMPNVIGGNLILEAHSGNNYNSFFKDLYKLENNDKVIVTYNGNIYEYIIKDIYNIEKNGHASIRRDYSKSTITLITCTKDKYNSQTIYIGYLEKKKCVLKCTP